MLPSVSSTIIPAAGGFVQRKTEFLLFEIANATVSLYSIKGTFTDICLKASLWEGGGAAKPYRREFVRSFLTPSVSLTADSSLSEGAFGYLF